jgi:hypothetical protein
MIKGEQYSSKISEKKKQLTEILQDAAVNERK